MAISLNHETAKALLRAEASRAARGEVDEAWVQKVERLSQYCLDGASNTLVAILGTAILARSLSLEVDLLWIKPTDGSAPDNAYSARTLCHGALVPLAGELEISLGVSGPEPLNNQPYFRIIKLGDLTPVHRKSKTAFDYMIRLVTELNTMTEVEPARAALRSFIHVRRKHRPRYANHAAGVISQGALLAAIKSLVADNSEGGKRAQAVVAGLMRAFAGDDRVESNRVNNPSRNYPGDVCVRSALAADRWEKAIEVRDKPVTDQNVRQFVEKCASMGVMEAAIVMVSPRQRTLDGVALQQWASALGIGLTLFAGWDNLVDQALFWPEQPKPVQATQAAHRIHESLIAVESSPEAVALWQALLGPQGE